MWSRVRECDELTEILVKVSEFMRSKRLNMWTCLYSQSLKFKFKATKIIRYEKLRIHSGSSCDIYWCSTVDLFSPYCGRICFLRQHCKCYYISLFTNVWKFKVFHNTSFPRWSNTESQWRHLLGSDWTTKIESARVRIYWKRQVIYSHILFMRKCHWSVTFKFFGGRLMGIVSVLGSRRFPPP